ncbi:MAG: hypothetical protein ACP5GA_09645 [Acidithiobacillus sp.]
MINNLESLRLAVESGTAWMRAVQDVLARAAAKTSIPMDEALEASSWSAEVTPDGTLHLALHAPGGEWATADVPWTQWVVEPEVLQ